MTKCLLITALFVSTQCLAQDVWTQKADFGGTARYRATGFSIGTKGYIGMGLTTVAEKDFWEYDQPSNTWSQKADFAGEGRYSAVGFSIGTNGYIGTGTDANEAPTKDFYEYNPANNTWTKKADFSGVARHDGVGFSIDTKGYIGTGFDANFGYLRDFYQYDPGTNAWTKRADFAGFGTAYAVGFNIGTKGYIGTGDNILVGLPLEFYEYNPATNSWTQEANFPGTARMDAVAFSIGTKGYVGTGYDKTNELKDFYEYSPATNTWAKKADFAGSARDGAVAFTIGDFAYVGTGADAVDDKRDFFQYSVTGILAVGLGSINAYEKGTGVQLEWQAQQEISMSRYEVERSKDGQLFNKIGNVAATGAITLTRYDFFDASPIGGSSFYRLKMVETTGKFSFSPVVKLSRDAGDEAVIVYPNPVRGKTISLQLNNLPKGNYSIRLINSSGQQVMQQMVEHPGGFASKTLQLPQVLGAGVYQLGISGTPTNITKRVLVK